MKLLDAVSPDFDFSGKNHDNGAGTIPVAFRKNCLTE